MAVNLGINIQRSPNRINQQLREAGVGGKYPKLLLDFADNYYLASGGSKTLANAVTHARAGNATMTDGYGPELVTNGSYSDGTTGWTANEGFTVSNGVATVTTTSGTVAAKIQQSFATEVGKTYILTLNLIARVPSFKTSINSSGFTNSGDLYAENNNVLGRQSVVFTATTTTTYLVLISNTTTAGKSVSFDNVSVREMPVIKWAPHNLIPYSEDFSNASWVKGTNVTVTANYAEAPDGTQTADRIVMPNDVQTYVQDNFNKVSGAKYVGAVWAKATSGTDSFILNVDSQPETKNVTDTWQLFTNEITATSSGSVVFQIDNNGTMDILFWGAHVYRSDLGGMVDNPERGDSYVPTTSSALYLPRIGEHVYNGNAWVNEGVLAESESRTNQLAYSNDFSQWTTENATITANDAISPSGKEDATKIAENSTSNTFRFLNLDSSLSAGDYTFSAYLKKETRDYAVLTIRADGGSKRNAVKFNLTNGTFVEQRTSGTPSNALYGIQDVGNGWYRCYVSITHSSGNVKALISPNAETNSGSGINFEYVGDGSSGIYAYQAQTEAGLTPSSLIPTDAGSSVTRAAETFTIPSANLPWPEPQYIGSELVTNGTFDTDSDWTISSADAASEISGGQAYIESGGSNATLSQTIPTVSGNVYQFTFDLVAEGAAGGVAYVRQNNTDLFTINSLGVGTHTVEFVAEANNIELKFMTFSIDGANFTIDNISVREINPLSVSIGMEGRMTFADTDDANEALLYRWFDTQADRIQAFLATNGSNEGLVQFYQEANDVGDFVSTANDHYEAGILTPFNLASRHGSTFINGANEGVALIANTTPTALADLSSTDMTIAHIYMGTISEFRVWDKDITDAGLVEATNPSLEPSLSLTFEGTGTNSFVVNDWSE